MRRDIISGRFAVVFFLGCEEDGAIVPIQYLSERSNFGGNGNGIESALF